MLPVRCKSIGQGKVSQVNYAKKSDLIRLYGWVIIVVVLGLAMSASAEIAMTRVVTVKLLDSTAVVSKMQLVSKQMDEVLELVLDVGVLQGLLPPAQIIILRPGEAIIHPLNGKLIGIPQEPVGMAQVYHADERQARAVMLKMYKRPRPGDIVEYQREGTAARAVLTPSMVPQENKVKQMVQKVQDLESRLKHSRQTQSQLTDRKIMDEIHTMKSYLLSLDERLIALEKRQLEALQQSANIAMEEASGEQLEELTVRYDADTQVRVQLVGKILTLNIEDDRIELGEVVAADSMLQRQIREKENENELPWYEDYHFWVILVIIVVIVILLAVVVSFLMDKHKYQLEDELIAQEQVQEEYDLAGTNNLIYEEDDDDEYDDEYDDGEEEEKR